MVGLVRRVLTAATCGIVAMSATHAMAVYPDRLVHFVVGASPGGSTDALARVLAQALSKLWGQPTIVENRIGGDNAIAADYVAHAAPDGYTIDIISPNHTITPSLQKLNYDPVKSFSPVMKVIFQPDVLVVNAAQVPVNSLQELIPYVKQRPGKLNFSSSGASSPPTMEMLQLAKLTGMNMVNVPFQGGGPGLVALLGGEVQLAFSSIQGALPNINAGKFKALAVSSDVRAPLIPNVPTVAEAANLPGFNLGTWDGILAPPGTPKEVVQKLHDDVVKILDTPDIKDRFFKLSYLPQPDSPEEFTAFLTKDIQMWAGMLKDMGGK